ncbi:MAG TPA: SpoIID/LytB domain-containing protein [Verrucomicrobiae bacterium]|jgi:stage II sporulation protein D|nr:SpoIID/LytB domain-containing protein [Verrucomicrobiae bacterium]
MDRAQFLAAAGAPLVTVAMGMTREGGRDASSSAPVASLRVLLGSGSARRIDASSFTYGGRRYRGTFSRLADGNVLSVVPLEAYLYGVVAMEMSPSWPAAALQIQAICARTYVLQRSDPRRNYDVSTSEADQVYGGMDVEYQAATDAVDATVGQILQYGGNFAQVAYSSCCGGHTEASADAWGGAPLAYLEGVVCPWCAGAPEFAWTSTLDQGALMQAVPGNVSPLAMIRDLRPGPTDRSGRLRSITLVGLNGSANLKARDFRRAMGARVVRSLLIKRIAAADKVPGSFVIEGAGLGHGVGLCQWGANFMAAAGRSPADIAAFYFPGTQIGSD